MKRGPGMILKACEMSFNGMLNREIAKSLGVDDATVSRWRRREIWIEFENELIAAHKKSVLSKFTSQRAEHEATAQG